MAVGPISKSQSTLVADVELEPIFPTSGQVPKALSEGPWVL